MNASTPTRSINLDFKAYTAANARATSIAGNPLREQPGNAGSPVVGMENRSYKGKTTDIAPAAAAINEQIASAKASGKPVVVSVNMSNPIVMEEIEPNADAILVNFGAQKSAVLDMLTGSTRYGKQGGPQAAVYPTAMLPMQLPKNMDEVERQYEDVPRDMASYTDSEGNAYDFGFGLTWKNGSVGKVDETVNPGFVPYVAENAEPMTLPNNKGTNLASPYRIENRMKVKFDFGYKKSEGDKENAKVTKIVNKGSTVTPLEAPEREGYSFGGWMNGGQGFDFSAPVTDHLVLAAKWISEATPGIPVPGTPVPSPAPSPEPSPEPPEQGESGWTEQQAREWLSARFSDADDVPAWALKAMAMLADRGILQGKGDGRIDPAGAVTRAEFAAVLVRGLGLGLRGDPLAFDDVKPNAWFKSVVDIAASNGVVQGIGGNRFGPELAIARQDLGVMIYRALKAVNVALPEAGAGGFSDDGRIAAYAIEAVHALEAADIVQGRSDGRFDPKAMTSRAEAAVILKRVLDHIESEME